MVPSSCTPEPELMRLENLNHQRNTFPRWEASKTLMCISPRFSEILLWMLSAILLLISLMFGNVKMSYLAQSDSILLFFFESLSRDKRSLVLGQTWPGHLGYWGINSLMLHSSGTVLWNGLCGSRFSALPLHAEFLLDFGFLVLPKGTVA